MLPPPWTSSGMAMSTNWPPDEPVWLPEMPVTIFAR
jgi:hypothetical protein